MGLIRFATQKEDAAYLTQVEASDKGHPQGALAFTSDKGLSPLSTLKRAKSPCEIEGNFEKVDCNLKKLPCEICYL